jgi:hypothetical protein
MLPANDNTAPKMKSVKDICYSAPFGEKRATAIKHLHAAETAQKAHDIVKMRYELNAATDALA